MVHLSHLYMTTGKTIVLIIQTFVSKVISLLFNMLPSLLITLLPRGNPLSILWLQSLSTVILNTKKIQSVTVSIFPHPLPWSDGTGCHDLSLGMWSFSQFFHSLHSSSSRGSLVPALGCYHLLIWDCWYFSQQSVILAYDSCSLAFCMMYSTYKLNKQGDNIQPWCTLFPIWNQSILPCPSLTVASWPANRFLWRQVRWFGISISGRIFQFVVIHTKAGVVNKAEVDVFLELSCFFDDPMDVGSLISGSSAFSKFSLI